MPKKTLTRRSMLVASLSPIVGLPAISQRKRDPDKIVVSRGKVFRHELLPGPGHGYTHCKLYDCAIVGVPEFLTWCEVRGCYPGRKYVVKAGITATERVDHA